MIDPADALVRRDLYAARQQIAIAGDELGRGHDGIVWRTSRDTALKICYREDSFMDEVACYQRLGDRGVRDVKGFAVPELVDFDLELRALEMNIVTPPFVLDFGKARVDKPHDFSAEVMSDLDAQMVEWWGEEFAPTVRSIIRVLSLYGIYHPDPRPGNIQRARE